MYTSDFSNIILDKQTRTRKQLKQQAPIHVPTVSMRESDNDDDDSDDSCDVHDDEHDDNNDDDGENYSK